MPTTFHIAGVQKIKDENLTLFLDVTVSENGRKIYMLPIMWEYIKDDNKFHISKTCFDYLEEMALDTILYDIETRLEII